MSEFQRLLANRRMARETAAANDDTVEAFLTKRGMTFESMVPRNEPDAITISIGFLAELMETQASIENGPF